VIRVIVGSVLSAVVLFVFGMASWVAAPSLPKYMQRVLFVSLLGAFAAIFRDVALYNWMIFLWPWTQAMITDVVVSWVLAGVILGDHEAPGSAEFAV
jgi:hypothetical protein